MPQPSTWKPLKQAEELAERWQARLVGKLCRVKSRWTRDTRGPVVVARVVLHSNDNRGPIFRMESANRIELWYFGGNGWDVEIYGEGIVHAP